MKQCGSCSIPLIFHDNAITFGVRKLTPFDLQTLPLDYVEIVQNISCILSHSDLRKQKQQSFDDFWFVKSILNENRTGTKLEFTIRVSVELAA